MTQQETLLQLFSDGEFHTNVELNKLTWWAFNVAMYHLRKKWYIFQKEGRRKDDKQYIVYWKLIHSPDTPVVQKRMKYKTKMPIEEFRQEYDKRTWLQKFIDNLFE